jgi:S1-C subfamily serine protease
MRRYRLPASSPAFRPTLVQLLAGAIFAAIMMLSATARAQGNSAGNQAQAGQTSSQTRSHADANSDAALEIMPRAALPSPAAESTASQPRDAGVLGRPAEPLLPPLPTSGPPSSITASTPHRMLPYLGVSVQRIESHSTPGKDIVGLEIVGVDAGSPAERAGLKGRGGMTKLGATGATAGALMAPLDIVMMPLLKKARQLGQTGDLIVAIDDRRVASEFDLENALEDSRPGDTMYFTVTRLAADGKQQTKKIPVKLGSPVQSAFP